jgi:hypothetical protein
MRNGTAAQRLCSIHEGCESVEVSKVCGYSATRMLSSVRTRMGGAPTERHKRATAGKPLNGCRELRIPVVAQVGRMDAIVCEDRRRVAGKPLRSPPTSLGSAALSPLDLAPLAIFPLLIWGSDELRRWALRRDGTGSSAPASAPHDPGQAQKPSQTNRPASGYPVRSPT